MPNKALFTSASSEWYTPPDIMEAVRTFYGRDFYDPCPAPSGDTPRPDGLAADWAAHGDLLYLNPPYGLGIGKWIGRALAYADASPTHQAILLVPGRTDTLWAQPLLVYPICFIARRLKFSGAKNSAPFPSLLVYLGSDGARFAAAFAHRGRVMVPFSESESAA
jgi:hypothetical protein